MIRSYAPHICVEFLPRASVERVHDERNVDLLTLAILITSRVVEGDDVLNRQACTTVGLG